MTYLLPRKINKVAQINLKFWGKVRKFNFGSIGILSHFLQTLLGPRTHEIFRKKISDFFIYFSIAQRTPKNLRPHLISLNQKLGLTHDTLVDIIIKY